MKKLIRFVSAIVASSACLVFPASAEVPDVIEGEYIVQRKPGTGAVPASASYEVVDQSISAKLVRPRSKAEIFVSSAPSSKIVPFDAKTAEEDCAEIKKDPAVTVCEPNYMRYPDRFPDDTWFDPYQTHLYADYVDQVTGFDTRAHIAWDTTTGSRDVIIGVHDSGINLNHPDLIPNLWVNPGETAGNGIDDDGNGYTDDVNGANAANNNVEITDCNGHGSHVSGIIGAKGNNNMGVSGVMWDVQIVTARNSPDCTGSIPNMASIKGFDYFYDLKKNRGINIVAVNGSFGGGGFSQSEMDAVARLKEVNIIFTTSAGNGGEDGIGDDVDFDPHYPSGYDLDNIVTVANLDNFSAATTVLATSSNFGVDTVDIGAPGRFVLSTYEQGAGQAFFGAVGVEDYRQLSGTSMSAPQAAGAIGLYVTKFPAHMNYADIIKALYDSARPISVLNGKVKTGSMINLESLIAATAQPDGCPSDPAKLAPGLCGCGVAENYTDTDADGTVNCADACPSDSAKSAAGTCGCGVPDADGNTNGRADCLDAALTGVTPPKPKFNAKNKKLSITPSGEPGVVYVITIQSTKKKPGQKKPVKKNRTITSASADAKIGAPKEGDSWTVTYVLRIPGAINIDSQASAKIKIKGKPA